MSIMRSNYNFTVIWTMTFIVFFAYFFVTASIVAFEDGFDETVNEKGYPLDFREASRWTAKEYIIWAMNFLPDKRLKYFKERVLHYTNDMDPIELKKYKED